MLPQVHINVTSTHAYLSATPVGRGYCNFNTLPLSISNSASSTYSTCLPDGDTLSQSQGQATLVMGPVVVMVPAAWLDAGGEAEDEPCMDMVDVVLVASEGVRSCVLVSTVVDDEAGKACRAGEVGEDAIDATQCRRLQSGTQRWALVTIEARCG